MNSKSETRFNLKTYKHILFILILIPLLFSVPLVHAQEDEEGPTYIVQTGDTLWDIALLFNVNLDDLMAANELEDGTLSVGQEILIPGLEGVRGVLRIETVPYGDNLRSLMRRTQAPEAILRRINRLVSPTELYAGVSLIVPVDIESPALTARASLSAGDTLLEESVRQNSNPWTLIELNQLGKSSSAIPNEILYTLSNDDEEAANASGLPAAFNSATVANLPLLQGDTAVIEVTLAEDVELSGSLTSDQEYPLRFFPTDEENRYVALQGVHAMTEPGAYPLKIEATYPDGRVESYEQMVLVESGGYPNDPILIVSPETLDPTITKDEQNELLEIISHANPEQFWQSVFNNPSVYEDCFTSRYGSRREYRAEDGSLNPYYSFHSGLDFCGGTGLQIDAAADGVVVFADETIVRGNATIIDHGRGVFTGYWHQSEVYVQEGDQVNAGDVIGLVGATGRVTGAHLHWEVWVNQVQVNPMAWLEQPFP